MSRELNKIFDVKTRQARRDILDKFDLSKEDKNKVLNKIGTSGGGERGNIAGEYYSFNPVDGLDEYDYSLYVIFLGLLSEVKFGNYNIINPTAKVLSNYWDSHQFNGPYDVLRRTTEFCFRPIKRLIEGDGTVYTYNTLRDALNNNEGFSEETINLILASIEPITEEEFYSVN